MIFRRRPQGLVDLEQIDIVERKACLGQTLRAAGTGAFSIRFGESPIWPSQRRARVVQAVCLGITRRRQQDRGRTSTTPEELPA